MDRGLLHRLRRTNPWLVDGLLAAAVLGAQLAGALVTASDDDVSLRPLGVFLLVVQAGALVFRRRAPFVVSMVVGAATAAYGLAELPDPFVQMALAVALYTVAFRCDRRVTLLVGVVAVVIAAVAVAASGDSSVADYYAALLTTVVALVLGDRQRTLAQERDARAAQAVADERARIARELHDVVAHHVSMMVVQAEAGAAAAEADGDGGVERFEAVASTGRDALVELRRLLGLLRDADQPAATAPAPGLSRLDDLIDQLRSAGLPVSLTVEGRVRALPDGVDLSAFRIVQEALTNVVKHADRAPTSVRVRYADDCVELEVVDEGGARRVATSGGHGLVGIRERIALFGGELRVGPGRDGFEVAARLPTGR